MAEASWPRPPHTEAKHRLLKQYLDAWFPIVAQTHKTTGITYLDGFAGPGRYTDGAPGSPLIAHNAARNPKILEGQTPVRLIFIEKDRGTYEQLRTHLDAVRSVRSATTVDCRNGDCEKLILPTLSAHGAWGGPIFANLDSFGVGVPYDIVKALGANPSTEVLITFLAQWFTRFANLEELDRGDRIFGNAAWRQVRNESPSQKKKYLVDLYLDQLHKAGFDHTLSFELVGPSLNLFLLFGTANDVGLSKMKNALWAVDRLRGERFVDPRDVNQMEFTLGIRPDLSGLRQEILRKLESGPLDLTSIGSFALRETLFLPKHAKAVVEELRSEGHVRVARASRDKDRLVQRNDQLGLF